MLDTLKSLYELQQIDSQIATATRVKAALDDGSSTRQEVVRLETELKGQTDTLRKLEAEQRDCELNLQTIESKKKNYERRMYAGDVTNPKELEGMEKEIAMLGRNKDSLETRILELLDDVGTQRERVSAIQKMLAERQAELAAKVDVFGKRSEELSGQIAELTAEREAAAKLIDEPMLRRYESLRARAGGVAIGKVEDGRCGACHVALTPYALRTLKDAEDTPVCENCGRLVYMPE